MKNLFLKMISKISANKIDALLLAAMFIGWLISSYNDLPIVDRLLLTKYHSAISALEKLHTTNTVLKSDEPGFNEIVDIVREHIKGNSPFVISELKSLGSSLKYNKTSHGIELVKCLLLEIKIKNAPLITGEIFDLENTVEQRYRSNLVFLFGALIFLFAFIIELVKFFTNDDDHKEPGQCSDASDSQFPPFSTIT